MVYLDDNFVDHPKVMIAGSLLQEQGYPNGKAAVVALFVAALGYARKHLTDGRLPDTFLLMTTACDDTAKVGEVLCDRRVRLWHRRRGGGFQIHDFLEWNWSADAIKRQRSSSRRRSQLHRDGHTVALIRARDGSRCRYCGIDVNWHDRRGPQGGTYDHIDPDGPNSLENVVVACRRCNSIKQNRPLDACGLKLRPVANSKSELKRI